MILFEADKINSYNKHRRVKLHKKQEGNDELKSHLLKLLIKYFLSLLCLNVLITKLIAFYEYSSCNFILGWNQSVCYDEINPEDFLQFLFDDQHRPTPLVK